MHNVTSTKQTVGGSTGLVALAVERLTSFYWHYYRSLAVAPTAAFSGTTSGDAPLTVSFADTSSGAPTEWSWNFGDGATSTTQNPTHTYTSPGTYGQPHGHEQRGQHHRTKSGYVTVRSPGGPSILKFAPVADLPISQEKPNVNYVSSTTLRLRDNAKQDYRFDQVPGHGERRRACRPSSGST